jgi:opacity protein-like surface antigen
MLSFFFSEIFRVPVFVVLLISFIFVTEVFAAADKTVYIRVGSGIALSRDTQFSDADCQSSSPAALFGCSMGDDGRAIGAYGDFDNSVVLDMSIGYLWNEWLRTEISLAYRPGFEFEGKSNFSQVDTDFAQTVEADLKSFSGMLVGIVKPLALFGLEKWTVEPILTAGLGFAHNSIDSMVYTFPSTTTTTPSGDHTDFAWTVGAGFAYALTDNIDVELLYRYSDLGEVRTDVDTITIARRSTNGIINNSIIIDETAADLEVNEILLSVVWYF